MNKNLRQTKILKLVQSRSILSQLELGRKLKAAGVNATQATLSRDLRELNLIKTIQGYRAPDVLRVAEGNHHPPRHTLTRFVIHVQVAGNLVVVKTNPGDASPVARALDMIGWSEIVGTVAGD